MGLKNKVKNKLSYEWQKFSRKNFSRKEQVLFAEPWNLEVNMIETANYLAAHLDKPILFAVPKRLKTAARQVLHKRIKIINRDHYYLFIKHFFSSKYFFTAHWKFPRKYADDQVVINLWHGIPYKNISRLHGKSGIKTSLVVATSPMTQKLLGKAFGMPVDKVLNTGYPRNDILVRIQREKEQWKQKIKGNLTDYKKVIIWLPSLRKDFIAGHQTHGIAVDNAFQVKNFKADRFNEILKAEDTLCLVKPHPFSMQKDADHNFSHIFFINDQWLWNQGLTVYHLAACTDALISDVSSIMIDYLLLKKPVICLSADFEKYKKERGFAFDNIEDWMPSKIIKNQEEFFPHLEKVLQNDKDGFEEKRRQLRDQFFTHHDAESARRLMEAIFD